MFFTLRAGVAVGLMALVAMPTIAAEAAKPVSMSDDQMRALGVELVSLQSRPDSAGVRYPAQVVLPPQADRVVSAPVAGLVSQILVQENQVVKAGTALLVLSSPELGRLQLDLIQAANRAQLASRNHQREQALFKDGIIPERRLEQALAATRDAEAGLVQARAALELAGVSRSDAVRIARTGEVHSELRLSAPTDGVVTALEIRPGQRVDAANGLLRLTRADSLWLDVRIPSGEAARWRAGDVVHVAGGAEARVLSVGPVANEAQTLLLRAALDEPGALRPGEFVQVELPPATGDAWDIPIAALARENGEAYVFVRRDASFQAVPVTVLASAGQRVQVAGALEPGMRIAATSVIAIKAAWLGFGGAEEE